VVGLGLFCVVVEREDKKFAEVNRNNSDGKRLDPGLSTIDTYVLAAS